MSRPSNLCPFLRSDQPEPLNQLLKIGGRQGEPLACHDNRARGVG
jgi:hypothetical protein